LENSDQWKLFSAGKLTKKGMRPEDIPSNPEKAYENEGWNGYPDFLGY